MKNSKDIDNKERNQKLAFLTYQDLGNKNLREKHLTKTRYRDQIVTDKTREGITGTLNYEARIWESNMLENFYNVSIDPSYSVTRYAERRDIMNRIKDLDHVFVYVGNNSGMRMIDVCEDLPQEKVNYVMCDCEKDDKMERIKEHNGHREPHIIWTKCMSKVELERLLHPRKLERLLEERLEVYNRREIENERKCEPKIRVWEFRYSHQGSALKDIVVGLELKSLSPESNLPSKIRSDMLFIYNGLNRIFENLGFKEKDEGCIEFPKNDDRNILFWSGVYEKPSSDWEKIGSKSYVTPKNFKRSGNRARPCIENNLLKSVSTHDYYFRTNFPRRLPLCLSINALRYFYGVKAQFGGDGIRSRKHLETLIENVFQIKDEEKDFVKAVLEHNKMHRIDSAEVIRDEMERMIKNRED